LNLKYLINKRRYNLGDWQDGYDKGIWGLDGMPYGIDSPCWNDNWEYQLRNQGYMTVVEWVLEGRTIKKGEKGRYLPCAKKYVFRKHKQLQITYIMMKILINPKNTLKPMKKLLLAQNKTLVKLSPDHLMELDI
jgi:hypothetical protein